MPGSHPGFIAQEVQALVPELVSSTDDTMSLNYIGLIPVLTKAVQELKAELDALKRELGKA
jgi:hypothetical protein